MSRYPDPVAEEVYDQLKSDRKINVKPIVKPIEQYVQEWQNRPYEKKAISEDVPRFKTMKGECVCSKISSGEYQYCSSDLTASVTATETTVSGSNISVGSDLAVLISYEGF